jgi:hypothetical protein
VLPCLGDENTDVAVLIGLRHHGVDVTWIAERGLQGLDDLLVAQLALREQRVLLTNDKDLLRLSKASGLAGESFPAVIYWPQQSRSTGHLLRTILRIIDTPDYATLAGQTFFA